MLTTGFHVFWDFFERLLDTFPEIAVSPSSHTQMDWHIRYVLRTPGPATPHYLCRYLHASATMYQTHYFDLYAVTVSGCDAYLELAFTLGDTLVTLVDTLHRKNTGFDISRPASEYQALLRRTYLEG